MRSITGMSEIEAVTEWLFGLTRFGVKNGLENIRELLRRLGDPQTSFRSIHVAGSDGKGSTCELIHSVLTESGIKTGLFTSPHILRVNERIRVGKEDISDRDFVRLAHEVRKQMESLSKEGIRCTFFEAVTAMAFLYFRERGAEYAVVEVGMGGRFDATNVLIPEVSVICNISMEHTQYLGDTIEKIAFEKAGIIKPGVPVVTCNSGPALKVIEDAAASKGSRLIVTKPAESDGDDLIYHGNRYRVGIPGTYQTVNAPMAIEALSLISRADDVKDHIQEGLERARWPGRMEKIDGLPLVVDVTHTAAGMKALCRDILDRYGRTVTVFGLLDDKDLPHIAASVAEMSDHVIVVSPPSERAMPSEHILSEVLAHTKDAEISGSIPEAIERALSIADGRTVVVTGSFVMAEGAYLWLESERARPRAH
ncbi:MAG: bifunctional folylpolyglutamate synthase/dihydrofolate synthase [Candidatus Methanomethylophilaceae archaeon]|nr:bifunctional folylpolyglutamate synthase/dihydrofolate synthase [Candidatus Methanomethylophilaceae archaeon]